MIAATLLLRVPVLFHLVRNPASAEENVSDSKCVFFFIIQTRIINVNLLHVLVFRARNICQYYFEIVII